MSGAEEAEARRVAATRRLGESAMDLFVAHELPQGDQLESLVHLMATFAACSARREQKARDRMLELVRERLDVAYLAACASLDRVERGGSLAAMEAAGRA